MLELFLWLLWDLPVYLVQIEMEYLPYLISILAIAGLCAGWVAVQLLAKQIGTKNHFENAKTCCGLCDSEECDSLGNYKPGKSEKEKRTEEHLQIIPEKLPR